jgi:serine/threonine protein kinase
MAVTTKALERVGDYDLVVKIGEGAAGAVYKGRHRSTGQVVAIKIVNQDVLNDAVLLKRFQREFSTTQRLDHPNIVRSFACDLKADPPYLVMEFIDGESLGDIIGRRGALPEAEAIALITQIAGALQEAHEHGIYHRDVKPDNILVAADGKAKLTDLGIAKDLQTECDLTNAGRGLGTPHFMAPEQLANAKNVDGRCDVYALGATLYMMVTGVIPFFSKGPLLTVFKKKAWNQYTPPRELVSSLSDRVVEVINRAMNAEIAARHPSCADFITHLTGKKPAPRRTGSRTQGESLAPTVDKSPEHAERRAAVRYVWNARGACRAVGAERRPRWKAVVQDISTTGICLQVNRRFDSGAVLLIEIEGKPSLRPRRLVARVVRVDQRSPRKWLIGCSFLRQLPEEVVREQRESL